jgi:hypothetical protein
MVFLPFRTFSAGCSVVPFHRQNPTGFSPCAFVSGHDFSVVPFHQRNDPHTSPANATPEVLRSSTTVEAPAFRPGNPPPRNPTGFSPRALLSGHDLQSCHQPPRLNRALAPVPLCQGTTFSHAISAPNQLGFSACAFLSEHDVSRAVSRPDEGGLQPSHLRCCEAARR